MSASLIWKFNQTLLEGWVEHHSLKLKAIDQDAIYDKLGVETYWKYTPGLLTLQPYVFYLHLNMHLHALVHIQIRCPDTDCVLISSGNRVSILSSSELPKIHLKLFATACSSTLIESELHLVQDLFNGPHLWSNFLIWLLFSIEAPVHRSFKLDGLLNIFFKKENMYYWKCTKTPVPLGLFKLQWPFFFCCCKDTAKHMLQVLIGLTHFIHLLSLTLVPLEAGIVTVFHIHIYSINQSALPHIIWGLSFSFINQSYWKKIDQGYKWRTVLSGWQYWRSFSIIKPWFVKWYTKNQAKQDNSLILKENTYFL